VGSGSLEFFGDTPELILRRADLARLVRAGMAATRVVADAAKDGFRIGVQTPNHLDCWQPA